jgi:hypothetical protein
LQIGILRGGICVEDPRSQKRDLGHPSSYPGDELSVKKGPRRPAA